jgi:hypothetical protein
MVTHFCEAFKAVACGFAYYFCVVKVHHLWLMLLMQGLLCVQAVELIEESSHIFCVQVMAFIKVPCFSLNKNFSWMHMCFVLCLCCTCVVTLMFQLYFSSCSSTHELRRLVLCFNSWPSYATPQLLTFLHYPSAHPWQLLLLLFLLCSFSPTIVDLFLSFLFILNGRYCYFYSFYLFIFTSSYYSLSLSSYSSLTVVVVFFLFIFNSVVVAPNPLGHF